MVIRVIVCYYKLLKRKTVEKRSERFRTKILRYYRRTYGTLSDDVCSSCASNGGEDQRWSSTHIYYTNGNCLSVSTSSTIYVTLFIVNINIKYCIPTPQILLFFSSVKIMLYMRNRSYYNLVNESKYPNSSKCSHIIRDG